jgi:hypothetical protein
VITTSPLPGAAEDATRSLLAAVGTAAVAAAKAAPRAAHWGALLEKWAAGKSRIAAANFSAIERGFSSARAVVAIYFCGLTARNRMLHRSRPELANFADWANSADCSAFSGLSGRSDCVEKEQSNDSAATDVGKDFDDRVGDSYRLRSSPRHSARLIAP